jgi:VWFA-related protein
MISIVDLLSKKTAFWRLRFAGAIVALAVAPGLLFAATVRVDNPVGSVTFTVTATGKLDMKPSSPERAVRQSDLKIGRQGSVLVVECTPNDGARIDLAVTLPYGFLVQARTTAGTIKLDGIVPRADLLTESGDIELRSDWDVMRLQVSADRAPREFVSAPDLKLHENPKAPEDEPAWMATDKSSDSQVFYGRIFVKATEPGRVVVEEVPFPAEAPFRVHWQAEAVVADLLSAPKQRRSPPRVKEQPERSEIASALTVGDDEILFRSDVRIVNLPVSVFDATGRPLAELKGEDFEILEDGVPQEVAFLDAGEAPFNLALLLDLSGSTRENRTAMKQAAQGFIDAAGPDDRVAAYALAREMLHVVSPLTADREMLAKQIGALPEVSGGTPLYDVIALAYDRELRSRENQRNALIVISDGVDNSIYGRLTPSKLSFDRLERVAQEMNALIYPILLDATPGEPKQPGWARRAGKRMERLAAVTGGRLFPAASLEDLAPVYEEVAAELRSVYGIAYYPKNQDFDGAWRDVTVRAKHPGARVRFRDGYYAR